MGVNKESNSGQVGLFDHEVDFLAELSARGGWPDPKEFPFNQRSASVGSVVTSDLKSSENPLIVTGYASLDKLIAFCSEIDANSTSTRILLGSEPYPS